MANAVKPTIIKGNLKDAIRTKDRTVLSLSGSDNKGHLNLYNVTGDVNSSGSIDNFEMVDISTDYNTGYIIGDIKGAFLSDTDTTNVPGDNLITNGDFSNGTTGWTAAGGNFSVESGQAKHVTTNNVQVYQSFTTVVGKRYCATYDHVSGYTAAYISTNTAISGLASFGDIFVDNTPKRVFFTATTTTTYFVVYGIGTRTSKWDNASVVIAEKKTVQ